VRSIWLLMFLLAGVVPAKVTSELRLKLFWPGAPSMKNAPMRRAADKKQLYLGLRNALDHHDIAAAGTRLDIQQKSTVG